MLDAFYGKFRKNGLKMPALLLPRAIGKFHVKKKPACSTNDFPSKNEISGGKFTSLNQIIFCFVL